MRQFSHTISTQARPIDIWQVWADVANWQNWDTELEYARLEGVFRQGSGGILKAKGSLASRFIITELTEGKSFTFTVQMPLANLSVAHVIQDTNPTTFRHEVEFGGLLGGLFSRLLGKTYAKALPHAMENIKDLAENATV